jgi:hypothetical protein
VIAPLGEVSPAHLKPRPSPRPSAAKSACSSVFRRVVARQRSDAARQQSRLRAAARARLTESRYAVPPLTMASLRTATPRLRKYFKDNYIPQICEVLEPHGGRHRSSVEGEESVDIPRGGARSSCGKEEQNPRGSHPINPSGLIGCLGWRYSPGAVVA